MYNITKFHLGKLCKNNHEYETTGQSLRYNTKKTPCKECKRLQDQRLREKKGYKTGGVNSFPKAYSLKEAVLQRTDKKDPNECWSWLGQKRKPKGNAKSGYGRLEYRGTQYTAHKLAWELHNKTTVPKGYCICHLCDNPECVNPDHLFLGSIQDNNEDKLKKQRQSKGEGIHTSKLTEEDIKYIKSLPEGFNQSEVARQFKVNPNTISNIVNGKRWKHI